MLHRSCNTPAGRQPPPAGSTVVPPTSGRGEEEEVQTDRTSCLASHTPLYTSNSLTLTFNTCSHYHPTFPSSPTPSPSSHLPLFPHSLTLISLIHSHPPPSAGLLLSGRTSVNPQTSPFLSTPQRPLQHTCLLNSRSHPPCGPTNSKQHDIQTATTTEMTTTTQQDTKHTTAMTATAGTVPG